MGRDDTRVELTNMVMIQNPENGQVVIIDRTVSWKGPAFPGGHIEPGESFAASTIREVREETGLLVDNLRPCGVVNYAYREGDRRYLVLLYKTSTYSGELLTETPEGRVFWADIDYIRTHAGPNRFWRYLPAFLDDSCWEMFVKEDDSGWENRSYL